MEEVLAPPNPAIEFKANLTSIEKTWDEMEKLRERFAKEIPTSKKLGVESEKFCNAVERFLDSCGERLGTLRERWAEKEEQIAEELGKATEKIETLEQEIELVRETNRSRAEMKREQIEAHLKSEELRAIAEALLELLRETPDIALREKIEKTARALELSNGGKPITAIALRLAID